MARPTPPSPRRLSRRRKLLFAGVIALVVAALLEGGLHLMARYVRRDMGIDSIFEAQSAAAGAITVTERQEMPEVVHPYVGFVLDPTDDPAVNQYGFLQIDGPILQRRPPLLIVGITGGSVAQNLAELGGTVLRERLETAFPGRRVRIVCLAQQGFKQPQQAMTWAFFRCLGAEFDVLVNLDGFNEAVLPPVEVPHGNVWFGYPRLWDIRLGDSDDPELQRLLSEGQALKQNRRDWARAFVPLQRIPLLSLHAVWRAGDLRYVNRRTALSQAIHRRQELQHARYSRSGPVTSISPGASSFEAQAKLWFRCSKHLRESCAGAGTRYIHCLQFNQHVPGTKPFSEEEHRIAIGRGSIYRPAVIEGYPHFIARSDDLRGAGVDFHDLTLLFADREEVLYRDSCCHLNQRGNELLAEAIGDLIVTALRQPD